MADNLIQMLEGFSPTDSPGGDCGCRGGDCGSRSRARFGPMASQQIAEVCPPGYDVVRRRRPQTGYMRVEDAAWMMPKSAYSERISGLGDLGAGSKTLGVIAVLGLLYLGHSRLSHRREREEAQEEALRASLARTRRMTRLNRARLAGGR